jgi:hypothetical protein
MAAVAVLGFTVAMLSRGAIQGMRYEGDASRRLAASLLADRALFEAESALALDVPPVPGRQEREDGEFRLVLEVAPLDPAALGLPTLFDARPSEPGTPRPPPSPATPKLFLVTVHVAWTEGLVEQSVSRATFAYDASDLAQVLEASEAGEGDEAQAEARGKEQQEAEPEDEELEP